MIDAISYFYYMLEVTMPEKPLAGILNREKAAKHAQEYFVDQIALLRDLADYGSNLLIRAFNSGAKDLPSIIACGVLLKHVVAMLDAAYTLVAARMAVLALSPYSQPFTKQNTLSGLSAPVMYQGGTRDLGVTPTIHKSMGSYDQSPAPKYYVEFDGASHFASTNVGRIAHEQIVAYSLAFMNHYIKGEPADPALTQALPGIAEFRYASELGNSDTRR